jgi:hypothetical protein
MFSVLSIDAAWTVRQPSGVALVTKDGAETWRGLGVAPSYAAFPQAAEGHAIPWDAPQSPTNTPDVDRLLAAARWQPPSGSLFIVR